MKKHDSRRLRFLTSFSYASLDVLLKQLATLFTYIHNTIYARKAWTNPEMILRVYI